MNRSRYCLQECGITPQDVDRVALVTKHIDPLVVCLHRSTEFSVLDHINQQYEYFARIRAGEDEVSIRRQYASSCASHRRPDYYDFSSFGGYQTQNEDANRFINIRFKALIDHFGFFTKTIAMGRPPRLSCCVCLAASPLQGKQALVFTADCTGDGASATVWMFDRSGKANYSIEQTNRF